MSVMMICESKFDLTLYGLESFDNGCIYTEKSIIENIKNAFDLRGITWSSSYFSCLFEDTAYYINENKFHECVLKNYLNSLCEKCSKIVIYYGNVRENKNLLSCDTNIFLKDISNAVKFYSKNSYLQENIIFSRNKEIGDTNGN